ncbi:MAG TPA: glycosyltransferase family 2 protein [Chryseolinea sp.]
MSRTAVVILNYNGEKLLPLFLPSVIQHSSQAEIIVADNASTDKSVAIVRQNYPGVRLILLDKNYGFCGGYNRAMEQVDADYCVLLNSDIEVTPGWLDPIIGLMDNDPDVASVQPKILSYTNRNKFEHAGAAGGYIDSLGYPFCRGRIFDHIEEDHGQYNDEREVFWATGACMVIRSSVFKALNGFDEDFFAHMEEIDLCWKLHRQNLKVMYCGKSSVFHVGAGTLGYGVPRKTYLNFRNGLSLIYKHLGTAELIYKFPLRIILDWVAALHFVLGGDARNAVAILNAHRDFFANIEGDKQKRKKIRRANPGYSQTGIMKGSVVFNFYILRRKTFRQ